VSSNPSNPSLRLRTIKKKAERFDVKVSQPSPKHPHDFEFCFASFISRFYLASFISNVSSRTIPGDVTISQFTIIDQFGVEG